MTATPATAADTPTPDSGEVDPSPTSPPLAEIKIQLVQPSPGSYRPATRDLVFQVTAYDPQVGTTDGAGINAVDFMIYDSNRKVVFENNETNPGYCAFSGGEPTCNLINFIRERKLWLGTDLPIESGDHLLVATAYAPDGRVGALEYPFTIDLPSPKLAFTSDRGGTQDIFVYDFDTGLQTNLTRSADYEGSPAWSPDGEWIAYDVFSNVSNDIYIINVETGEQRPIANNTSNEISPTWSPDGDRIAYASDQNGNFDIYVANIDGTNVQQLTFDPADETLPAWSPDRVMIAFTSYATGNGDIYLMNARGEGASPLVDSLDQESSPAWAPDSGHLVFNTLFISNSNIYWMELTNGWTSISLDAAQYDYEPEVSPDGSQVAFTSSTRSLYNAIYVMNSDGSGLYPLIQDDTYNNQSPAWLP
jgi:Tol biopolymer transport system component